MKIRELPSIGVVWQRGLHYLYLFASEVTLSIVPYGVEYKGFRQQHFNLVVPPVLRRQGLQKHDYPLGTTGLTAISDS